MIREKQAEGLYLKLINKQDCRVRYKDHVNNWIYFIDADKGLARA